VAGPACPGRRDGWPLFAGAGLGHLAGMANSTVLRSVAAGAAAGAAGAAALNAATYLDMAARGRPASSTPERTVELAADEADVPIPGDEEQRRNRVSGLGALTGVVTGVAVGAAYGLARAFGWRPRTELAGALLAGAAMSVSDGSMALLGVTDPRRWRPSDWAADLVPHLAYGLVTAAVTDAAEPAQRRRFGWLPGRT
jgi:hypothetical protein